MNKMINGVATEDLFATIEAVKDDPTLASFNFRIKNQWAGGGLNRTTVEDFYGTNQTFKHETPFALINDEPPVLLSDDKGPNPVENLLHALAGCLTTSIVYHAAARGIEIDAINTKFEGDLDLQGFLGLREDIRNGYSSIRVVFDIEGDMTVQQKQEIKSLGPQFSPVFDCITNGVPVSLELNEAREMETA